MRDWVSIAETQKFTAFVKEKLGLMPEYVEKRNNKKYGTYFLVYSDNPSEEELYFGRFGKLIKSIQNGEVYLKDDFNFLDENPMFMMEYLAFMHESNKIDGKPRRLNGKTFIEDFKESNKIYQHDKNNNEEKGE